MSTLALGLVAAGATGTAAFAAGGAGSGTGTGNAASPSQAGNAQGTPAASSAPRSGSTVGDPAGSAPSGPAPVSPASPATPGSPTAPNSANGNKGHIEIEGAADCTTSLCGQDNDPHVAGCTLTVELLGYPSGMNSAALTISGQAPSGSATVLSDAFTFVSTAPPNGSYLDTARSYTPTASQLAALAPQANQGYHLRVDVAVNGFPAKTHVVWLGCTPILSASTSGMTGSRGLLRPIGDAPAAGAGSPVDAPDGPVALAGARGDSAAPASSGLAFTGLDVIAIVAAAAVALLVGVGFVVLSRRAKRVST